MRKYLKNHVPSCVDIMQIKSVTIEGPPGLMRELRKEVRSHVRMHSPYYKNLLRLVAGRPLQAGERAGMLEVTFELSKMMRRQMVRTKVLSLVSELAVRKNMPEAARKVQLLYKDGRGTVIEI